MLISSPDLPDVLAEMLLQNVEGGVILKLGQACRDVWTVVYY